jgi:hypothetical protein
MLAINKPFFCILEGFLTVLYNFLDYRKKLMKNQNLKSIA